MAEDSQELTKFFSEFYRFQGKFDEFKTTTERRLSDNSMKLQTIENELKTPHFCPAHEGMIAMIAAMKNGETRQDTMNVKVDAEQKTQNKDITALEKKTDIQEFKLNWKQETQLNVASVGTVIIFLIKVVEWIMAYWGKT